MAAQAAGAPRQRRCSPIFPGLSEVALACGFANQSHFTRVFSAMAGIAPGAWRRQRRRR
ncbi:MAG: helix-turn-helix domain-containing protein [Betaproteobacteria bacterium]